LAGAAAYRFLPPFFFPPLAVFFAIALYPPLRVGSFAKSLQPHIAASRPTGTPTVRLPALVASLLTLARRRTRGLQLLEKNGLHLKKSGVRKFPCDTPRTGGGYLALLPALFLAALRSLLRH